jgi:hypothetical protein
MKAFEKWHFKRCKELFDCNVEDISQCKNNTCDSTHQRETAWKAALEWMKQKLKSEIQPGDIEYFIDQELEEL